MNNFLNRLLGFIIILFLVYFFVPVIFSVQFERCWYNGFNNNGVITCVNRYWFQ